MAYLPNIEVETKKPVNAAVIWLHGLGASGHDFLPIVPELALPKGSALRFVFPHAPEIPVTINSGMVMRAWYDILDAQIEKKVDTKRLLVSAERVQALIDREVKRGVESKRIVLAGFSQGGAVAYHAALNYSQPLAGVFALSTYLATGQLLDATGINRTFPIQIYHGTLDPVVPPSLGKAAHQSLKSLGVAAGYQTYPMQHAVCPEEIRDISTSLQNILGLNGSDGR